MRKREEIEENLENTHYQGCIRINSEILLDIRDLLERITKGYLGS